jgi:hypothetical protein
VPGEDPHDHHMTITVFDCDKNTLELFNPCLTNHEKSIIIVEQTMNKVFQNVCPYKTDIEFVDVGETCPFIGKFHIPLNNTPFWDNTCSTFSLWYMFERILFPDKDSVTILNDIKRSLGNRLYAEGRIRTIILTFLSLVDINIETCEVKSADGERTRESDLLRSLKKNGGSRRKKNCNRKKTIRQRSKKIK